MRQDGGYFNASNGLRIGVNPFTSMLGRIGLQLSYETRTSNFYAKVSRVREFDGDLSIYANGVPISESLEGSWWVYGIGYTARFGDRQNIYLDVERTSGGDFTQERSARLGWRYLF